MPKYIKEDIDRWFDYSYLPQQRTIYLGSISAEMTGGESESGTDCYMAEFALKAILHLNSISNKSIVIHSLCILYTVVIHSLIIHYTSIMYFILLFLAMLAIFDTQILAIFRRRKEIGTLISLVGLRLVGRFGLVELWLTTLLIPGVLVGFLCSRWTATVVDRGYTRVAVLGVAATTGVIVIVRQLF